MPFVRKRVIHPHIPGFYNFNGRNLLRWQIANEAVKAGVRNAKLLCVGDSTTEGYGSTNNGHGSNAKSQAYPTQLAALLPNASIDNFLCDQFIEPAGTSVAQYDNRIVKTSGTWNGSGGSNQRSLGGNPLFTDSSGGILSFTPANAFDTVEVHYVKASTTFSPTTVSGSFTIDVDGGAALATVDAAVSALADAQGTSTNTCSLSTHTVNITQVSNGVFINGIVCYDSSSKKVLVMNAGWQGSKATDQQGSLHGGLTLTYTPLIRIRDMAPDLMLYMETINDWNAPTSVSTYATDMQTVLTTQIAVGDAILVSGFPSNPATKSSLAVQKIYVDINQQLALTNGIPFINLWELFGSNWGASGYMVDSLHPNAAGYGRLAAYVNRALTPGFRS